MWILRSVRVVSLGVAVLVLVLSGAPVIAERGLGAGSSAGAASPRLLQVDPAVVEFPDTLLGTQAETSVQLTNEGSSTDSLYLPGVSFSGPGAGDYRVLAEACPTPQQVGGDVTATVVLMPGQSCNLAIYFTPGGRGDRSATMTIQGSADEVVSL